ncbi:MAG: hypothetical protein HQM10_07335 [Candidatus Riflebacteria bacterium]|nr:hypothetical protein [Candidatus Riflebacteria bacterium]
MYKSFLTIFLVAVVVLISTPLFSTQILYIAPDGLTMKLSLQSDPAKQDLVLLTGNVEGNLGNISSITMQFFGSPGITVEPASASIPRISKGEAVKFEIRVKGLAELSGKATSWVKMRADYVPDYKTLIEQVKNDEQEYPDQYARQDLLQGIMEGQEKTETISQVIGYLLSTNESKDR